MNHLLRNARVLAKAAELGFDGDGENNFDTLILNAEFFIRRNSDEKPIYERCELSQHKSQHYYWCDELSEYECSGDIFDFTRHYKASSEKIFKDFDENGEPIFIDWFEVEEGDKVFYIFEELVDCNGNIVRLYC